MFYSLAFSEFPAVKRFYSVTRNTVWQIAEKEHLLICIQEGRCSITVGNTAYSLKPGDVCFIPAETAYIRKPAEQAMCTMTYIHFTTSTPVTETEPRELIRLLNTLKTELDTEILGGETTPSYPNTLYLETKTGVPLERLETLFKGINLYSAKRPLTCSMQASVSLCAILLLLSQQTLDDLMSDAGLRGVQPIPAKLKQALGYIARHHSEPVSLSDLASFCSVSKQQMIRYFRSSLNTTPVRYITDYKMSRAKELLFNHPQTSIKEIATELGFENQHYFTRVFIRVCGETPSQYRRRTVHYGEVTPGSAPLSPAPPKHTPPQ